MKTTNIQVYENPRKTIEIKAYKNQDGEIFQLSIHASGSREMFLVGDIDITDFFGLVDEIK